jgi:hypothetical protein
MNWVRLFRTVTSITHIPFSKALITIIEINLLFILDLQHLDEDVDKIFISRGGSTRRGEATVLKGCPSYYDNYTVVIPLGDDNVLESPARETRQGILFRKKF